jgi:arylsulfatase A-like enzyme
MILLVWILLFSWFLRFQRRRNDWLKGWAEELFVAGLVSLLFSLLPLWIGRLFLITFFFLSSIDFALYQCLGLRLRKELLSHFFHPKIYWSSLISFRKQLRTPIALFLTVSILCLWIPKDPSWMLSVAFLFCGFFQSTQDHWLNLGLIDLQKKRTQKAKPHVPTSFPTETALFLSPDFPLLRRTLSFQGDKQFSMELKGKPNIFFFFLESFRSKNVGCLGAKDGVTPFFDALSQEGILFTQFFSNGNTTAHATISSLFGIPPSTSSLYQNYCLGLPLIGLPQILQNEGYQTALIQGAHLGFQGLEVFFRSHGFHTLIGKKEIEELYPHLPSTSWGIHDEEMIRFSMEWLKKQTKPVFLNLFSISNHHPWICPPSWTKKFDNPYLNTMAYTDWVVGEWVRLLKESLLFENSLIFLFGDHGQSLNEHNLQMAVHSTLFEENIHVPLLLLAGKKIFSPKRIDDPCSQMDLLPTLLDLLHLKSSHHSLGTSLLRKKKRFVFSTCTLEEKTIAGQLGKWKTILKGSQKEVYHLGQDPNEKQNLAKSFPQRAKRLEQMTKNYSEQLQSLYENRSFAPPQLHPHATHFSPPKEIFEKEFFSALKQKGPFLSLDLSGCSKIGASFIKDANVRYLNLSGCLRVTDKTLQQLPAWFPELRSLHLASCLLISDEGVATLLQKSHLEELNLEGLEDLTTLPDDLPQAVHLQKLNLAHCPRLKGKHWAPWIASLPSLRQLHLSCSHWSDSEWEILIEKLHTLRSLALFDAEKLSKQAIRSFLAANQSLTSLWIQNCPNVDDELIQSLENSQIRSLTLVDLEKVTDKSIRRLRPLSLQCLILKNCPKIQGEGLIELKKEGYPLILSTNSNLSQEQIQLLQSKQIHLFC